MRYIQPKGVYLFGLYAVVGMIVTDEEAAGGNPGDDGRVKEVTIGLDGAKQNSGPEKTPVVKQRILVCEDSTPIRKMMAKLLQANGFEVVEVSCGQQALNRIYESDDAPFCLALVDLMLPDIGGLEILGQLRKRPTALVPPVVICSSSRERHVILTASKLGVAGYIAKPFKTEDFIARVRAVISGQHSGFSSASMHAVAASELRAASQAAAPVPPESAGAEPSPAGA